MYIRAIETIINILNLIINFINTKKCDTEEEKTEEENRSNPRKQENPS